MAKFIKLIRNNEGATAIEYGMIAALVSVALIVGASSLGNAINATFSGVETTVSTSTAGKL